MPSLTSSSPEPPILEAQGWQVAADGKVVLVAAASQPSIAQSLDRQAHCQ